jgi:hypothetical protein
MRDAEDILGFLTGLIDQMYQRPSVYIGSLDAPGKAHMLVAMLWQAHLLWAYAVERSKELDTTIEAVWKELNYGDVNLVDAYRQRHPFATEEEVSWHVLKVWHSISQRLGITVREMPV